MSSTSFQVVQLLQGAGYTLVHTWNESHGDGGSYILQKYSNYGWNSQVVKVVVSFDRVGNLLTVRTDLDDKDYLLALELAEQVRSGETRVLPNSRRTSPCCTSSWYLVENIFGHIFRVVSVAGHETYAVRDAIDLDQ